MKIIFTEKTNELTICYHGFKTTINLDTTVFSNCDLYIDRIKKIDLENLSVDKMVEINKIIYELRDSLNVNSRNKNAESLKKALSEIHAAMIMFKFAIPYISGEASGVAVEETANC